MTPLPLTYGALFVDASTLERLHCPRKLYNYWHRRRESNTPATGRDFGSAVHAVLAHHYTKGRASDDFLQQCINEANLPDDDYRNIGYLKELYQGYCHEYPEEPFTLLQTEPRTELSFAMPLGIVQDIPIVWTGRVDLPSFWPDGSCWNIDHKTSSIGGPTWWQEYECSLAQKGYVWALQQTLRRPIEGFMINAVFTRRITATGKGIEYARQKYPLEQQQIVEWRKNTLALIDIAITCFKHESFPMLGPCVGKFRACDYLPVCSLPEDTRELVLLGPEYRDVTWSPLNHAHLDTI